MSASKSPQSVFVIGKVWPEPTSSAAGIRILQILKAFQEQGFQITFASSAGKSPFSFDLNSIGIEEAEIELNNSSFDAFIAELNPEIVLFDRFSTEEQFGWRVVENCPETLRILDTEDLHCLREGRRIAFKEGRAFVSSDLNNDIAKREIASILRCDLSLIISEVEMNVLQNHFRIPAELLVYVPFIVDGNFNKPWNTFENRKHFVSIGNFLHEPNWDAVLYLKQSIWPTIRSKIPTAELHICGAYPSQKVHQLHNPKEGFLIKGRAEDALEAIENYRVLVAPLRFGAGLKGKLIDAMQTGTPSITTSIGAEGMNGDFDWPGVIVDSPQQFAEECIQLHEKKELWENAQSGIKPLLKNRFSAENLEKFMEIVSQLSLTLDQHRSKNFLGQMLMHHSLASTKFMSKWIEEKNKIK
ncbi:MAG: glycosyltransferase [Balneolaceae bacterium]|nr:glycosyltransferase [Balneolaceae bacterium]